MKYVDKIRNELPEGWKIVQLEEILERITNGTTEKQSQEPPGLPVTRIETISHGVIDLDKVRYLRDLDEEKRKKFTLQEGDILFSHINSDLHLGKTAVVHKEKDLIHGMNLLLLRFNEEANPQYMNYLFNLVRARGEFIAIAQHAVNQSSLNQGKIKSIEVPLAPPEQQKRIVAKIEELFSHIDAGIEALKKAKQLLKQYRQSVLKAAVTGDLTKEWRAANKAKLEPASQLLERILKERRQKWEEQQLEQFKAKGKMPKDDKWKEKYKEAFRPLTKTDYQIPETWVLVSVDQVSGETLIGLVRSNALQSAELIGSPYLKMNNINMDGNLELDEIVYVEVAEEEQERYELVKGDILFNTRNSVELVGKTAMATDNVQGFVFNNNIMRIRLVDTANPEFIALQMCSPDFRKEMERVKRATTSIAAVYGKDLFPLPLVLPPLMEQLEIARLVDEKNQAIQRMDSEIDTQLKKAEKNKQSVLASAFTGRLAQ